MVLMWSRGLELADRPQINERRRVINLQRAAVCLSASDKEISASVSLISLCLRLRRALAPSSPPFGSQSFLLDSDGPPGKLLQNNARFSRSVVVAASRDYSQTCGVASAAAVRVCAIWNFLRLRPRRHLLRTHAAGNHVF